MQAPSDDRVEKARVDLLYSHARWGVAGSLFCAGTVAFFLAGQVSPWSALWWFLTVAVINGVRLVEVLWHRVEDSCCSTTRWKRIYLWGTLASGLTWGSAALFIYPADSILHQALLGLVVGGLGAATLAVYSIFPAIMACFVLPAMLPIAIRFFIVGDPMHAVMGSLSLVFVAVLLLTGIRVSRLNTYGIEKEFESRSLIEGLKNAKADAEELNTELRTEIEVRRRAEEALNEEKEKVQVTLESIAEGVVTTDTNGLVNYINPVAERLSGWSRAEARGVPFGLVFELTDEETDVPIADPINQCLLKQQVVNVLGSPVLVNRLDKSRYSVEITVSPIRRREEEVIGAVLIFRDITELRNLTREMSYQASHDSLTGLINRREFERRLQGAIESAHQSGIHHSVCYLDLDQFKLVNDSCGHHAGDELLKQLSSSLQACLRESDALARLGGDEFGVLLEGCRAGKATEIAEKLRNEVENYHFQWDDRVHHIGSSIGVVAIDKDSTTVTDILGSADAACYLAKEQGRNRIYLLASDDMNRVRRRRTLRWIEKIRGAMTDGSFQLFQQELRALSDRAKGHQYRELLLRMEDGDTILTPTAFLSFAERFEIMPTLDRLVVRRALEALTEPTLAQQPGLMIGINISAQSLSDKKFLDFTTELIQESGISPDALCFEITETAAISNLARARQFIIDLKEIGCKFALDDFGAGWSSFGSLKRLPVDFVKIDGAFVVDMLSDPIDHSIVESITKLGRIMDVQIVAEAVETEEVFTKLQSLGVDWVQGHWVASPRPITRTGS